MKKSTYRRPRPSVSTVKKSQATIGCGLGTEELAPAELGTSAGRRDATVAKDLGDRRRRYSQTDACELADDPLVAPARILTGET
jgi:hypothetical protein